MKGERKKRKENFLNIYRILLNSLHVRTVEKFEEEKAEKNR